MKPLDRRTQLVRIALRLATRRGFDRVSRAVLAREAKVSPSLVQLHWPAARLRAAIMEEAVRSGNLRVIAQGLVARHTAARAAPLCLRKAALAALLED